MLMTLALAVLAAATAGSVAVYQRDAKRRLAAPSPTGALPAPRRQRTRTQEAGVAPTSTGEEPTLETLQGGDIVVHGDEDWLVRGTVRHREERDRWQLHLLEDGARTRWLEVRARPAGLEVAWLQPVDDVPTFGQLLQGLSYRGMPYTLDGRGDARTQIEGDVDGRTAGLLRWARYVGAGGALLLVEQEGPIRRAWAGERVPPSSLMIMSGELNRADDAQQRRDQDDVDDSVTSHGAHDGDDS